MKKIVLLLIALIVLSAVVFYFFIPDKIIISKSAFVKANTAASYRSLSNTQNWFKLWPEKTAEGTNRLTLNGTDYVLRHRLYNLFFITLKKDKDSLTSQLLLVPLSNDSMSLEWRVLPDSSNTKGKIRNYFTARSLQKDMGLILASMKSFLQNPKNLYEAGIKEVKVKDTVLVASRFTTTEYPSVTDVYNVVQKLKGYIEEKGAKETDYPMLHIDSAKGKYLTMVGIPTDTTVDGNGKDIELKRMVLGNILVTEIKGGPGNIKNGMRDLELYINDYHRMSPAIPFQSLITDRSKQPDTTQWVTKIYYPVF